MSCLRKLRPVMPDEPQYAREFVRAEAQVARQRDRLQPHLGRCFAAVDVDVRRLVRLVALEVEAEAFDPEDRRHPPAYSAAST
jgi:hypothetical protein